MISVKQATSLISQYSSAPQSVETELINAVGMVLAEAIYAPIPLPSFDNSAMDGYAIRLADNQKKVFRVVGEIKAGDNVDFALKAGEAVRIFTGAMVPKNCDTVVMQEQIEATGGQIRISKSPLKGANIRLKGEQLREGDLVFKKGKLLHEASIGVLAGLGFHKINVFKSPSIALIVTGNELQLPGTKLAPGKIYESNSVMLCAALKRNHVNNVTVYRVKDNPHSTKNTIGEALEKNDVVLLSGGISVGKYDFVQEALQKNQVQEVFYKINQKPGKPLWFGKKGNKSVFALPGNPASSLVCFYGYVLPELKRRKGLLDTALKIQQGKMNQPQENKAGKTLFLKAHVKDGRVTILNGQSSAMLLSFAQSNALALIPAESEVVKENEKIEYIDLGYDEEKN